MVPGLYGRLVLTTATYHNRVYGKSQGQMDPLMSEHQKDDELPPISYSVDDAARVIGIGPATVWKWVAAKEIPVIRIGRRTVIRHNDLVAFVERHRQP